MNRNQTTVSHKIWEKASGKTICVLYYKNIKFLSNFLKQNCGLFTSWLQKFLFESNSFCTICQISIQKQFDAKWNFSRKFHSKNLKKCDFNVMYETNLCNVNLKHSPHPIYYFCGRNLLCGDHSERTSRLWEEREV